VKVIEHVLKTTSPCFSHEIVPPPRGRSVQELVETMELLIPSRPAWIDVTSHASVATFQEQPDGSVHRKVLKKRPGTIGICGILQNRFKVDTVAHILAQGFSKEETEDALIELRYLGIENVLALKGDTPNYQKVLEPGRSSHIYAKDLVNQLSDLRRGIYMDDGVGLAPMDFCVGVAGYPEKHFEAANSKTCIQHLKAKVEAGADYIVTQMFFETQKFVQYVEKCREVGINVPIIPGLKVLRNLGQLKSLPRTFHIDLPSELVDEVMANPQHVEEIGVRWTQRQVEELLNLGFLNIHFYVLNDASLVAQIIKGFL
jgi:methylenetetrahydrofolate reductase (NADPH)